MQDFPHRYTATALARAEGEVTLESAAARLARVGAAHRIRRPGRSLVAGDAARRRARRLLRARLPRDRARLEARLGVSLRCEVEGTLDRVERVTQFTAFSVRASLQVPPGTDLERARGLLEKAEKVCLISNSLKAQPHLEAKIEVAG